MTSPSGPATEIAYVPLQKNIDIDDQTTPESKAWNEALEIIQGQDGYLGSRYGRQIENPDVLIWLIDWASHNSHITFMNSPAYPGFLGKFSIILDGKPRLCHFLPGPVKEGVGKEVVLEGVGCTEFAVFYDVGAGFGGNVEKFVKALDQAKESIEGYHGACFGGVIEDVKKGGEDAEGEVRKAVVLCIGWDSKDAHMKFRNENPIFKENIWLLREENGGAEVVHVKFKKVV